MFPILSWQTKLFKFRFLQVFATSSFVFNSVLMDWFLKLIWLSDTFEGLNIMARNLLNCSQMSTLLDATSFLKFIFSTIVAIPEFKLCIKDFDENSGLQNILFVAIQLYVSCFFNFSFLPSCLKFTFHMKTWSFTHRNFKFFHRMGSVTSYPLFQWASMHGSLGVVRINLLTDPFIFITLLYKKNDITVAEMVKGTLLYAFIES